MTLVGNPVESDLVVNLESWLDNHLLKNLSPIVARLPPRAERQLHSKTIVALGVANLAIDLGSNQAILSRPIVFVTCDVHNLIIITMEP